MRNNALTDKQLDGRQDQNAKAECQPLNSVPSRPGEAAKSKDQNAKAECQPLNSVPSRPGEAAKSKDQNAKAECQPLNY